MLSRRLLRVKVMQIAYSHYSKGDTSIQQTEKELYYSIAKSHELYHSLLLLLLELQKFADKRIEFGKQKRRPSHEDLNPNMRFVENAFLKQLAENDELIRYAEKNGVSWVNTPETVKGIFNDIVKSSLYLEYVETEAGNYEADQRFVAKLMEKVIAPYEGLYSLLEEQSIFWNDEAEFIISMVVKTIKAFDPNKGDDQCLLPEYKDDEDRDFVKRLIRKTLANKEEYMKLIRQFTKNWDFDRIAIMDIVLMQIAIAEVVEFPNIPVNVSLNEYIEIAKYYSTNKSGLFINGVLDKIVEHLIQEKKIVKPLKAAKN